MNDTIKKALTAAILAESGRALSKLYGRRNYAIRMEMVDKDACVGGYGVLARRGLMGENLMYMAEHGVCWAEFTYKKDFMAAVKALEDNGFTIYRH